MIFQKRISIWNGPERSPETRQLIYVYSSDVFTSLTYAIDQNLAPVISMSYGECEQSDLIDLPTFQSMAQQGNAQGITWLGGRGRFRGCGLRRHRRHHCARRVGRGRARQHARSDFHGRHRIQ